MEEDEIKQLVSKKQRIIQKYRDSYSKEWPCFIKCNKSVNPVFCTDCDTDFSIASSSCDDCRWHYMSKKLKENTKCKVQNTSLVNFYKRDASESDVMRAEMLFSSFIIEHNIPIASTEDAGPLFCTMFPDPSISIINWRMQIHLWRRKMF